ncbi:MAG: DUF4019 domain-containing protein [Desulfobulbus sp.]
MKMLHAVVLSLLFAFPIPSIHAAPAPDAAVVAAARSWMSLIDAGDVRESWKTASGFFRTAVSEDGWTASIRAARTPLGAPVHREYRTSQQATSLPGAPDGDYSILTFTTDFTHKKSATETVTFMLEQDGQWRAAGYFIK